MSYISESMRDLLQSNSVIREMFEEGNRLAVEYGREQVYDYSLGNPNVPAPEAVRYAAEEILEHEDPRLIHGYMSNAGFPEVRRAVAESLNERFQTAYTEKQLIMTAGAAAGLNILLKTILNLGDEVIVFAPFFSEYRNYVGNYGGRLVVVAADTESFQPDLAAFSEALSARTKAVLINTPNNPSGVVYTEETLRRLNALIEEGERRFHSVILTISDEPYRELVYDSTEVPWVPALIPHAVVVYSYSKSLSLPGERIGWLLVPDTVPEAEALAEAATVANRICGFVNAPSLIQRVLMRCLHERADVAAYDRNRKLLYGAMSELGFYCVPPQGAFYLLVKAPDGDDRNFAALCKKYHVLVVPCSSFACPSYVRMAYCVSHRMIERSLPALQAIAEECFGSALRASRSSSSAFSEDGR